MKRANQKRTAAARRVRLAAAQEAKSGPFIPPVAAVPQRPIALAETEHIPVLAVGSLLAGMLLLLAWVTNEALVSVGRGARHRARRDRIRLKLLGGGLAGLLIGFVIALTMS